MALVGCGDKSDKVAESGGPVELTELTIATAGAPTGGSVNPAAIGNGIPDQFFTLLAYDSLIIRQPDGTLAPGLALEWKYLDDKNTQFQMKLRPGVTFSDGSEFTAEAVKGSLEWWRDGTGLFASRFAGITSIDVTDDLTVVLNLAKSDAAWPQSFTQDRYGPVISPIGIANEDALATETHGAGPYVLDTENTVLNSVYVYVPREDDYWNPDAIKWSKITIQVIADPSARLAAMQSGQVDVATGDATTADAAKSAGLNIAHAPYLWNSLILMDRAGSEFKPLGNEKVRQALQYAVERDVVAEAIFGDYGSANATMVTPGYDSYNQALEEQYTYDPDKARAMLAEAGYPDGFTMDVLGLNRQGLEVLWTQALIGYYEDIGIKLVIHEPDRGEVLDHLVNHTWPVFMFFGQIEEANLLVQEQLLRDSSVLNPYKYEDETLANLYAEFHVTPLARQAEMQQAMQARIMEAGLYATYSVSDVLYYHNDRVTGLDVSTGEPIMNLYLLTPTGK